MAGHASAPSALLTPWSCPRRGSQVVPAGDRPERELDAAGARVVRLPVHPLTLEEARGVEQQRGRALGPEGHHRSVVAEGGHQVVDHVQAHLRGRRWSGLGRKGRGWEW
eukprot:scaffold5835_cov58-Phaeocystis_antarctica.AAC.7